MKESKAQVSAVMSDVNGLKEKFDVIKLRFDVSVFAFAGSYTILAGAGNIVKVLEYLDMKG